MSYSNLDKMSYDLYYMPNFVIKHVVKVAHKDKMGKREYCHSEYTYLSNSYSDKKYVKSLKLNFKSYLVIEELDKDWNKRETLAITQNNIVHFKKCLKEVKKWFYKKKYNDLYFFNNGVLSLNSDFNDLKYEFYTNGKLVMFKPTIVDINNEHYEGVTMYINNTSAYSNMSIDTFETLYDIIKNFNLYLSGLSYMSYIGRPEFGQFNSNIIKDQQYNNKLNSGTESTFRPKVKNPEDKFFS